MKISTRTRYGTRLMVELGCRYGQHPAFLKDIAAKENISEKYLSQIIIPLKTAGLVNSFRGAHGGYVVARPPEEITLKEIVEVLEGDLNLVGCVKNASECQRASICVTRNLWGELGQVITQTLEKVTLQDLVKQSKEIHDLALMYSI